jgi:hypothetical protein
LLKLKKLNLEKIFTKFDGTHHREVSPLRKKIDRTKSQSPTNNLMSTQSMLTSGSVANISNMKNLKHIPEGGEFVDEIIEEESTYKPFGN